MKSALTVSELGYVTRKTRLWDREAWVIEGLRDS